MKQEYIKPQVRAAISLRASLLAGSTGGNQNPEQGGNTRPGETTNTTPGYNDTPLTNEVSARRRMTF